MNKNKTNNKKSVVTANVKPKIVTLKPGSYVKVGSMSEDLSNNNFVKVGMMKTS